MNNFKRIALLGILMSFEPSFAQIPSEIQVDNDPTDWSNPWIIALCIGVPILLVIGGILIHKKSSK